MMLSSLMCKRGAVMATSAQRTFMRATPLMQVQHGCFLMAGSPQHHARLFSTDNRAGGADEASHDDFQPKSKVGGDSASDDVTEHISSWIQENDVCIFMKGTRKMPQCGFSRYVVVLLNAYGVKEYKDVNVLADETLRSTIKAYSNWPTIPQVYIKGEFIGGCDIMKEMHEDGSLRELLIRENIIKE